MSLSKETYEKIDSYLNGSLVGSERISFEKKIADNQELKNEIDAQRAIKETVFSAKMGTLSNMMDSDFNEAYSKAGNSTGTKKIIASALAVAVLGVVGFMFVGRDKKDTSNNDSIDTVSKVQIVTVNKEKETAEVQLHEDLAEKKLPPTPTTVDKHKEIINIDLEIDVIDPTVSPDSEVVQSKMDTSQVFDLKVEDVEKLDSIVEDVFLCPEKNQDIQYKIVNPSLDVNNGFITITGTFQGLGNGTEYRIVDSEDFSSEVEFSSLEPNDYRIEAKDENDCIVLSNQLINLKRTGCSITSEKVFSPVYDDEWILNVNDATGGTFKVLSLSGVIIASEEFSAVSQITWNGRTLTGEEATPGQYYYEVSYWDNERCLGKVTLAR